MPAIRRRLVAGLGADSGADAAGGPERPGTAEELANLLWTFANQTMYHPALFAAAAVEARARLGDFDNFDLSQLLWSFAKAPRPQTPREEGGQRYPHQICPEQPQIDPGWTSDRPEIGPESTPASTSCRHDCGPAPDRPWIDPRLTAGSAADRSQVGP